MTEINFSSEDARALAFPQHNAIIIMTLIANYIIKRTLIDNGCSTNVIFLHALQEMQIPETQIVKKFTTLIGFNGEQRQALGELNLSIYCE